jgi:hypothetical protein
MKKSKAKILIFDIETSYTVGAVWSLYDTNVATTLREPYIISVAYKWLGEKTTQVISLPNFASMYKLDKHNDILLVKALRELFDKADIVVAHNCSAFDYKWVYGRFAVHSLPPPSPCKQIDTLLISRSKFKFNSHKLNDLGQYFKLGKKVDTGGIQLWVDCIEHNKKDAWAKMCKYNKQDVVLLEKVYLKLLPFITNHPNLALMEEEIHSCPNCKSTHIQKRGFNYSKVAKYQAWQCQDCRSWHQSLLDEDSQIR